MSYYSSIKWNEISLRHNWKLFFVNIFTWRYNILFQFKNTCVQIHTAFRNHTEYIISLYRIAFNLMIVLVCIEMFCYVFIVLYCIILVHVFITSQNNVKFSYRILIITSKLITCDIFILINGSFVFYYIQEELLIKIGHILEAEGWEY